MREDRQADGTARDDGVGSLPYWAGGIVLALAMLIAGQAWLAALVLEQERSARQSARLMLTTARALERERRELSEGVAKLTVEVQRRLSASATTEGDIAPAPLGEEAAPPKRRARSPLEGKSIIRRAGI